MLEVVNRASLVLSTTMQIRIVFISLKVMTYRTLIFCYLPLILTAFRIGDAPVASFNSVVY